MLSWAKKLITKKEKIMGNGYSTTTHVDFTLFDVKRCGLYKKWDEPPLALSVKELIEQIKKWGIISQKPLIETSVYSNEKILLPAYLWGVEECPITGNSIIALWNEIENHKGAINYVSGSKPVGTGTIDATKAKAGQIPGFMSIFWVIPSRNIIVAINTEDHSSLGIIQLRKYLNGFLNGFSEQIIRTSAENGEHTAFTLQQRNLNSSTDARIPDSKLKSSIQIQPLKLKGEIKFIKSNVVSVRKLIRKVRVRINHKEEYWHGIKDKIGFLFHSNEPTDNREIKIEYPTTINAKDVDFFVKQYIDNSYSNAYDVTFVFTGDIPNKSLSGIKAEEKFPGLKIKYSTDNTPVLLELLTELNANFLSKVDGMLSKRA